MDDPRGKQHVDLLANTLSGHGRQMLAELRGLAFGGGANIRAERVYSQQNEWQRIEALANGAQPEPCSIDKVVCAEFSQSLRRWRDEDPEVGASAAIEKIQPHDLPTTVWMQGELAGCHFMAAPRLIARVRARQEDLQTALWEAVSRSLGDCKVDDALKSSITREWLRLKVNVWRIVAVRPPGSLCLIDIGWARVQRYLPLLPAVRLFTERGEVSMSLGALEKFRWPKERDMTERARSLIESTLSDADPAVVRRDVRAEKLFWRLLPPPPPGTSVGAHLREVAGATYGADLDMSRLDAIEQLGPDRLAVGLDELMGYVAFVFSSRSLAVLDCPRSGNAIYILEGNWQALSQCSKAELLALGMTRVVHSGDWQWRLRKIVLGRSPRPA